MQEKTQEARDSRRKETKHNPQPSQETRGKHRENTARGTHQPREKKRQEARGRESAARGTPPTQRETKKAPLDAERKSQNTSKSLGGSTWFCSASLRKCKPIWQRPRWAEKSSKTKAQNNKKTTHTSCRQSVLLNLVVRKTTVVVTIHPHPGTPKQRRQEALQGRSLKGSRSRKEVPKHQAFLNFPNTIPIPSKRDQTHKNTVLRRTPRGGGAHGPPRFSGESLQGTLVPRSRSSPTKVTAPGSAIAFRIQKQNWDPRESSAASPPLRSEHKQGQTADKTGPSHITIHYRKHEAQARRQHSEHGNAQEGFPGATTRRWADTGPWAQKIAAIVSPAPENRNRNRRKIATLGALRLFREHCSGRETSLSSAPNSVGSAKKKSVSSLWHENNGLRGTGEGQKLTEFDV